MQRIGALQAHDLNNTEAVEHIEGTAEDLNRRFDEAAPAMRPGLLSLWCWDPKEGWQHIRSVFRVTTTGPVREARHPMPPPEPYWVLPGEGSALEFAPEDFSLA